MGVTGGSAGRRHRPLDIGFAPRQGRVAGNGVYRTYRPAPPMNRWVHCLWQLEAGHGQHCYRSVPDNCVDWIINADRPDDSFLVAPFASPLVFEIEGPVAYFGIRFRILGQHTLVPVPVGEWAATRYDVPATDLTSAGAHQALAESIGCSGDFAARSRAVERLLPGLLGKPRIDSRVARFVDYCCRGVSSRIPLSDGQCSTFGLSARQLRRLSRLYLGLSPRGFARVVRFQRSLGELGGPGGAWADCFYDQPHFVREFKRLSGLAPRKFVNSSVLYNRESG